MKDTEDTTEVKEVVEHELSEILKAVTQDTEQIITKSCEAARQEAEQELERTLREYEQKTKQIVLKIRQEAKSRAAEIANRLGEAIMRRIEKSSTDAIADVVSELSGKAEKLTKTMQETAKKEAKQAFAGMKAGLESSDKSDNNHATQEDMPKAEKTADEDTNQNQEEPEKVAGEAKQGFEIEVEQDIEGIIQDEASGEPKQTSEEFEQWLTQ